LKEKLDGSTLGETKISVRAFFSNEDNLPETPLMSSRNKKPFKAMDDFGIPNKHLNIQKDDNYKFKSEDPNLLGDLLSELRGELDDDEDEVFLTSKFKPKEGGDAKIIDGPHDYAYNKLKSHQASTQLLSPSKNEPGVNGSVQLKSNFFPNKYQGKPSAGSPALYASPSPTPSPGPGYYNYYGNPPVYNPHYSDKKDNWSQGQIDARSWSSASCNSFLSVGGRHPQMGQPGFYPFAVSQLNYLPPNFMTAIARQQLENYEAWNKSNDGELTTSSGCDSDRKKAAAQSKIKNLIDQKCSKVVHVKGLEGEEVTNEIIASLFSNFGNINKVLFLRKKHTALVEYHDVDSASVAKEMLNNLTFFGSQLKVCYSTYGSVAENLATSNNPEKFKDVYTPSPKSYRFKEYKKISINPPSKILHLSNIAREVFSDKALTEIFSEHATVKKVKLLNLGDEEKCMALIELASLESALACISTLHNRVFFSRNIKISFTRSKI
jgi:RNA recognition motif-containing protein